MTFNEVLQNVALIAAVVWFVTDTVYKVELIRGTYALGQRPPDDRQPAGLSEAEREEWERRGRLW